METDAKQYINLKLIRRKKTLAHEVNKGVRNQINCVGTSQLMFTNDSNINRYVLQYVIVRLDKVR